MSDISAGVIESRKDFKDDPQGQYEYWDEELKASKKARKDWHKQGDLIVKRFIDSRKGTEVTTHSAAIPFRLNLFHSNVTTLTSMLYGNVPTVDVSRRYADPNDDVSRVAAEVMERILNNDIAENGEEYNCVLRSTLQDRLLSGLGCARLRYEVETEESPVMDEQGQPTEQMEEKVTHEAAPMEYFHWRDVLWGWARNWAELPWLAYRVFLNKDEVTEAFGEDAADGLQFKKQLVTDSEDTMDDPDNQSPWSKAEIWEIWDKTKRKIVFYSKGYDKILETKEDSLKLRGFFPSPPFFMANQTTTLYSPTPDYHLSQDLYNEIDKLQTRIAVLTEAVKVVGVYDASSTDSIGRMFKEGIDNTLIPVENWALFGEKGGLQGQIDWVPLVDIVNALDKLRELRDETIGLLQQVTGMAEIMRGGGGQYEGTGQAQLKAKFGSVRVQALQDEFATFASDAMQLKAEIISRHFSPETIAKRSNMTMSMDADMLQPAIELIKNPETARLKVEIRPESVAMVDYAQLKGERTDYINALSTFMQSAAPLMEQDPTMQPFLLQLLQWGLAGFKGASEIEGVIDKAIQAAQEAAKKAAENPEPDPAQQAMEQQMQMEQAKGQIELQKIQAKAAADSQIRDHDMQADIQTAMATHQAKLTEIDADMRAAIAETQAKMQADIMVEQAQSQANVMQAQQAAGAEIQKDAVSTQLELEKEAAKTSLKIQEITAQTSAKIKEAKAKPKGNSDAT